MHEATVTEIEPDMRHLALEIKKQHITDPQVIDGDGLEISP